MAYLKEGYWRYVGVMAIACLIVLLTGCSVWDGLGSDKSGLTVDHSCEVDVTQHAYTAGDEKAKVVESIRVAPDCTTEIDFKQDIEE